MLPKQGELIENILQNLRNKWSPHLVVLRFSLRFEVLNSVDLSAHFLIHKSTLLRRFKHGNCCQEISRHQSITTQIDKEIVELRNFFDDHREEMMSLIKENSQELFPKDPAAARHVNPRVESQIHKLSLERRGSCESSTGMKCIKIGLPGNLILSKRKGFREILFA